MAAFTSWFSLTWLEYRLLWAERAAAMESLAYRQARSNEIVFQARANKLRRQIAESKLDSSIDRC